MSAYDAIVIGSGQAGNPLSQKLADRGWSVALIEQDHLGGTCINTGCTPTKTMVASAQVFPTCPPAVAVEAGSSAAAQAAIAIADDVINRLETARAPVVISPPRSWTGGAGAAR